MKIRRFVSLMLALLMLASLTAVLSSCDDGEDEQIVIRVLENDYAKKNGYLQVLLDAFNEKYKEYNVVAVDADMDEYSDLENDGPYGYGPDVLYQANDVLMKYVDGHHIYPIDVEELECYGQIPENAWDAYRATSDGRVVYCGVPVNVQQPLLYYRKDMLPEDWETEWDANSNGVPDMVEFWSEMYRYSKEIRESDRNKFGFALQLNNEYFNSGFLFSYGAYIFGNDNTDDTDIGLSSGNAKLGAKVIWELAGIMDEKCSDDSFTNARTTMLANGTIFATICTPDITTNFLSDLSLEYQNQGLSKADADAKAKENLVIASLPKLPVSGDITATTDLNDPSLWIEQKTMGGINGYGISSYSEHKDWALKFIEFATSAEMIEKRAEMLGIVPARGDVVEGLESEATRITYENLDSGTLVVMPSISSVKQIWTPISSGLKQIATDGCGKREMTLEDLERILETMDDNIYKAIHTFSK